MVGNDKQKIAKEVAEQIALIAIEAVTKHQLRFDDILLDAQHIASRWLHKSMTLAKGAVVMQISQYTFRKRCRRKLAKLQGHKPHWKTRLKDKPPDDSI